MAELREKATTTTGGPGSPEAGGARERMGAAADEAGSAAGELGERASEAAGELKAHAGEELATLKDEARANARDLTFEARQRLSSQADESTRSLAAVMADASHELRTMAERSENPEGTMTEVIRQLASRSEGLAHRLEDGGYQAVAADLSRLGRNRPGLFLLAAGAAGFAVGRLLRNTDTRALTEAAKEQPPSPVSQPPEQPMLLEETASPMERPPASVPSAGDTVAGRPR